MTHTAPTKTITESQKYHDINGPSVTHVFINRDHPRILFLPVLPTLALRKQDADIHDIPVTNIFNMPAAVLKVAKKPACDMVLADMTHDFSERAVRDMEQKIAAGPWAHKVVFVNFSDNKNDIIPTTRIPTLDFDGLESLEQFYHADFMAHRVRPQPKRTFFERLFA
jgi:hypothetical protein